MCDNEVRTLAVSSAGRFCNYSGIIDMGACPDDIAKFYDVARFGTRVEKVKSRSKSALAQLAAEGRRFELAYFDGSHHRDDVPADSFAAWPPIVPGGIVIWDNYEWRRH